MRLPFKRFLDLEAADVNCDLHCHTNQTDGQASITAVLNRAVTVGLDRIAFTEHVRRETDWFPQFAAEIRQLRQAYPQLTVLVGCEAKALDTTGGFDASEALLAECEIVLGSVHRFPNGQEGFLDFEDLEPEAFAQIEFELAWGLLMAAPIDVLAHPGGMYARWHGDFPRPLMRRLMEKSLERGIAMEISTSYVRDLPAFLSLCAEVNPYVSIGSDMHRLADLGRCRDLVRAEGVGRV